MRLLAEQGAFSAEWTRPVFERVPRHTFAPDTVYVWQEGRWRPVRRQDDPGKWTELVFHPTDAPVTQVDDGMQLDGDGGLTPTSSISCVAAVINMITSLAPEPGDTTLEIGTGAGYNAAILAERVGARNVVSVEIDQSLADEARSRLATAGYGPTVVCGDGEWGYAERAPLCPPDVMLGQLDRLVSLSALPNVRLGVIGFRTPYGIAPWHGFWIFDRERVVVETYSAGLNLAGPAEVALYEGVFDRLAAVASYGRTARQLITRAADDLAAESEPRGD